MMRQAYRARRLYHSIRRKIYNNEELASKNSNCRCLVMLHLFYNNSWKEIRQYLFNLNLYRFDLIVTATVNYINSSTVQMIHKDYPEAKIIWCENNGYDLLPFFIALKDVDLDLYDVVFKIHSKSTKRPYIYIYEQLFLRRDWFQILFEGILSERNVHNVIDLLYNNCEIGLIAAKNLIIKDPKHKRHLITRLAERYGYSIQDNYQFVAGTCFAVKSECLRPIQEQHFENKVFESIPHSRGMSLSHFLERYICISIQQQGYVLFGTSCSNLKSKIVTSPIARLLKRYSSERLLEEKIDLDDEWFFWKMDNKLIKWEYDYVKPSDLKYYTETSVTKMIDGAPYLYLSGNKTEYEKYCDRHMKTGKPLMSKERYDALISSIEEKGYDSKKIVVVDENNGLLDGQHRACILAMKNGADVPIRVLRITMLHKALQKYVPLPILQAYRIVRYKHL